MVKFVPSSDVDYGYWSRPWSKFLLTFLCDSLLSKKSGACSNHSIYTNIQYAQKYNSCRLLLTWKSCVLSHDCSVVFTLFCTISSWLFQVNSCKNNWEKFPFVAKIMAMKAQHLKCSIAARSLTLAQQMRGSGANRREKQRFLARYLNQSSIYYDNWGMNL